MCTRILYASADGQYVVAARNSDWAEDMRYNLWISPREEKRNGLAGANSLTWTSKYGSVGLTAYDKAVQDGVNEKGLAGHLLWLAETEYGDRNPARPGLSLAMWLQFVLDSFATVREAVEYFHRNDVQVFFNKSLGGAHPETAKAHLGIGDASGDSAVFEVIGAKVMIYHQPEARVLTNSPPFDEAVNLLGQYEGFGGSKPILASVASPDRFVRVAYFLDRTEKNPSSAPEAVAIALSVVRTVAQPFGTSKAGEPNTSATQASTAIDLRNLIYYYANSRRPGIAWVRLAGLDFTCTQMIDVANSPDLVGDISAMFRPQEPFPPLAAT